MKLIFAVFVLGIAGSVNGQIDDDRNAATWYRKAIEEWQKIDIPYDQWMAVWEYEGGPADRPAPEAVRKILAQFQPALRELARAGRGRYSDFGDDLATDFGAYGDYLPPLQRLAKIARLDAQVRLNDGDVAGATGRITDLYRLASHLPQDERMISSLVGMAIFAAGDSPTSEAIDRGVLGMGEAAKLAEALEPFARRDAFDLVPALEMEKEMLTAWALELYTKRDNLNEMIVELEESVLADPETLVESSALLDPEVFDSSLVQMENAMDQTIELFQLDDRGEAQFELELLAEEIARGDHGPLAALVMVDMHKAVKRTAFLEERIAERHALLTAIARGEVDPKSLINAAIYYRQAMDKLQSIDPTTRESWVKIASQPRDESLTPEQIEAVDRAAEIIALLREGAAKLRCSFTDEYSSEPPIAEYLIGMYELTLVLRADTVRALRQGETSNVSANLLAGVGMARHLAADGTIVGSMTAHVSLVQMTPHIERGLTLSDFSRKQRTTLRDAVRALPQRDPFGYRRAVRMARSAIADELSQQWGSMPPRQAEQFAQQLADEIVFYGRMLTASHHVFEPRLDRWIGPTAQIRELFDVEAFEAVFAWLAAHRAKLQQGDTAVARDRLLQDEPVMILPLLDRMAVAEADLAAIRELLITPHEQ